MPPHPIRFGLQTGQQNVEWSDLLETWTKSEGWGYDSLWAYDHFYPIYTDPTGPCLEGWTTLAALAQATSRVRIGHLVTGNTYRHPSLVAKMAATVDQVSAGRLNLGLGAGWFEAEHTSLGFDYKTLGGRLRAFEESLQIVTGMLGGEIVTLDGAHYQVRDARCNPGPVQDKVPVMIGGEGRKVLLRLVAQYADLWNTRGSPAHFAEVLSVLRQHGDTVGRDIDEIEKSVMLALCYSEDEAMQTAITQLLAGAFQVSEAETRAANMIGGRQECLDRVGAFQEQGVTHFIFMMLAPYPLDQVQAFAEDVAASFR